MMTKKILNSKIIFISIFIFFIFLNSNLKASVIITGDTSVCKNEMKPYSVVPVSGGTYSWSVTNGNVYGTGNTVNIQWNWVGTGTVSVIVYDSNNIATNGFLNVIVHPLPQPTIAVVPYPTCGFPADPIGGSAPRHDDNCINVCEFSTNIFSTPIHTGSTYFWTVTGDLGFSGQGTNTINVNWGAAGNASVLVVETSIYGCVDSAYLCVVKTNKPIAGFTAPASVCLGTPVAFTNTSSGAVTYFWDFGDGNTSTAMNPTHTYASGGTYTITLIAENSCHCSDTFIGSVTVDSLPGPPIDCPGTVCADAIAQYSTTAVGCVYNWIVTGGIITSGAGTPQITVQWGAGQIGTVGLFVTGCGSFCTDTTFITIPIVPSIATISGDSLVCAGDCNHYSIPKFMGNILHWTINGNAGGSIHDTCCNEVEICWGPFSSGTDTLFVNYYDSILGCGGTGILIINVRPKLQINGNDKVCVKSVVSYFANTNCNWYFIPSGPTILSGNGSNVISVLMPPTPGNFILVAIPTIIGPVCEDSTTFNIAVKPLPAKPIITGDTVICPNTAYTYYASSGSNITWLITGGTPIQSNATSTTILWNNVGPYSVSAFQTNVLAPFCSSDTAILNIQSITPLSVPNIGLSSSNCANDTSTYTNTTIYPSGVQLNWTLSPPSAGSIYSGQGTNTVIIQWGNNAPLTVTLTLSVTLCNQTVSNAVNINLNSVPAPIIVQTGNLCPGGSVTLSTTAPYTTYNWLNSTNVSISTSSSATATITGLFQVIVTDINGCRGKSSFNVNQSPLPVASISTPDNTTICIGSAISVTMYALTNPNYTYLWSNGSTSNPTTVTAPGTYTVVVTDVTTGCSKTSNTITISLVSCISTPCDPNGSISFTDSLPTCNPVIFYNTSVNGLSYSWNFGDGAFSSATNPTHTYAIAGYYLVTLTGTVPSFIIGGPPCTLQDTRIVTIPLAASFSSIENCGLVTFTDQSTFIPSTSITSWSWNFGDPSSGILNSSSLQNPTHIYNVAGSYTVTLTISNGVCSTTYSRTITVNGKPTAAFTFPTPFCVNENVLFSDASLPLLAVNYWNWNFGDAGTSLNQNANHSYSSAGNYTVTLWVKDLYGCKDTIQDTISILSPAIVGNIMASPDTIVCQGTNVTLTAPTGGSFDNWSTGASGLSLNAITVIVSGLYSVTITDSFGCKYVPTPIHVIVNPKPEAMIYNTGADELCFGDNTFLLTPMVAGYTYLWITTDVINNGATVNQISISSLSPGTYFYQVIVTNTTTGCFDTSGVYTIIVHPLPVPPVINAIGSTVFCKGDSVILWAFHPDSTVHFLWSTGEVTDTIIARDNGCYKVIAFDSNGCKSDVLFCITVNPLPDICPFWTGCLDTCNPYTIWAPPGNATYQWLLNNNPIFGATQQSYTATISGAYSVILSNIYGCYDTTGEINLNLYACMDSNCVELITDSLYCDSNGHYVYTYHLINHSGHTINETNMIISPFSILYGPVSHNEIIPNGDTSSVHAVTITNASVGQTLCFRARVHEIDSMGHEIFCCSSDSFCYTMPLCPTDTNCCGYNSISDSFWCDGTDSLGNRKYGFRFVIDGCGQLDFQPQFTTIFSPPNLITLSNNTIITGTFINTLNTPTFSATFSISHSMIYCIDRTLQFQLPPCDSICFVHVDDSICVGQSTTFTYSGTAPLGSTYAWTFNSGIPSSASGPGPHSIMYNTPGCHPYTITITKPDATVDKCSGQICVITRPVATISQIGNTMNAYPAGNTYQWYNGSPFTIIPGEVNQFFAPANTGYYCVVVSNSEGCSDTACRDFIPTGINDLSATFNWTLYPNPNTGQFVIDIKSSSMIEAEIEVVDAIGKVIFTKTEKVNANTKCNIDLSSVTSGVYFVKLKTAGLIQCKRVVIE